MAGEYSLRSQYQLKIRYAWRVSTVSNPGKIKCKEFYNGRKNESDLSLFAGRQ